MKVEIDGNSVRIKGDICGTERHLKITCMQDGGEDCYMISVVKDGFEIGCGGMYLMNKNHVIEQTYINGKRFID